MERDGIALVYYPLVPGPECPDLKEVWSTWRFDYPASESEKLVKLCKGEPSRGWVQML